METPKRNNSVALISRIRDLANKLIVAQLEAHGFPEIATSHGEILFQLYRHQDGLSMKELAKRIRRDKSTLTVLVRKLEYMGYISRTRSLEDGRVQILRLTEKAEGFHNAFISVSRVLNDTAFQGFKPYEIEMLIALLKRMLENLKGAPLHPNT